MGVREEHRLRVFEKQLLRIIFEPKVEEIIECWRKLHSEELHNVYLSPNIIEMIKSWKMKLAGHVA
jgi:hypothetical protein